MTGGRHEAELFFGYRCVVEFTWPWWAEDDSEVEFVIGQHRFDIFLRNFQKTDCDRWMRLMKAGYQRTDQIQR